MTPITLLPAATPAPAGLDKAHQQLQGACQQFEGYFLNLMFQEMRKTVPDSGLLGDQSDQRQIFTGMMDQTVADAMSKRGDLGISQMLYDQLAPALGPAPGAALKPTGPSTNNQTEATPRTRP